MKSIEPIMFKKSTPEDDKEIDEAIGVDTISIRLPHKAIFQLELLAHEKGLTLRSYIRMVLVDHVRSASQDDENGDSR